MNYQYLAELKKITKETCQQFYANTVDNLKGMTKPLKDKWPKLKKKE